MEITAVKIMMPRFLLTSLILSICMISSHTCSAFNDQKIEYDGKAVNMPAPPLDPCKIHTSSVLDSKQYGVSSLNKPKMTQNEVLGRTVDWPSLNNCTDDDITAVEPVTYDHWKLHVIMACTVTAAVEFVIIIFIILYWKQIRWTLRKLTCPCDDCQQHEAMEPDQTGQPTDIQSDVQSETQSYVQANVRVDIRQSHPPQSTAVGMNHLTDDHMVHTFSAPWYSRVECGNGDGDDVAVPGPSGLSSTFKVFVRHSSDSDESLDQVKPHRTAATKKHVKGAKGRKVKSGERRFVESSAVSRDDNSSLCIVNDSVAGPSQCSSHASNRSSPIVMRHDGHMTDCGRDVAVSDC